MPSSTLIIPTFNRQQITLDTLGYLNYQTVQDFEVIVVDQTKSDFTDLDNYSFENGITKYKYKMPNAKYQQKKVHYQM